MTQPLASRCRTALLALLAGPLAVLAAEPPAAGLIVRLKPLSSHDQSALQAGDATRRDAERWQRVLRDAGVSGVAARRAVGRDQQHLDFGRALPAEEARRLAQQLAARRDVDWVEPNTLEQPLQAADPADALQAGQWWARPAGGTNANAPGDRLRGVPGLLTAWHSGIPGASDGATVAVLDTGVTDHPDLHGRLLPGYDFVSDAVYANDGNGRDNDPRDTGDWVSARDAGRSAFSGCRVAPSSWHGTIVAGQIAAAADNGVGIAGVQWRGRILPVRVAGKCGAALADIIDGMRWAAGLAVSGVPRNPNPARIVNISFGGSAACGMAYQSAVNELRQAGVVVVAAAGNDSAGPSRPASCRGVVGVVALNRDGFKAHYSNFGGVLEQSGIATVGGDSADGVWGATLGDGGLLVPWNGGATWPGEPGYAQVFGTSFAAPLVAGTAALMIGVNPDLSAEDIVRGLRSSARPHVASPLMGACSVANPGRCVCGIATCGAGILDADQALRFAIDPAGYTPPARTVEVIDTPELRAAVALGPDERDAPAQAASPRQDTGGGALAPLWLLGLLIAVGALWRIRTAPGTARTAHSAPAA